MLKQYPTSDISGGINLASSSYTLEENEARFLQDILLDIPGQARQRGPLEQASGTPSFANKAVGIVNVIDPSGIQQLAVLHGTTSPKFGIVNGASTVDLTWPHNFSLAPYTVVDYKPSLSSGVFVGTSSSYKPTSNQALALWHGGTKADYSTGTLSVTIGTKTVTGSGTTWSTNLVPGMFLFATSGIASPFNTVTNTLLGVIASVDSNTQVTLKEKSPVGVSAGAYSAKSIRGIQVAVTKGTITCSTASATVTGARTKFVDHALATGQWGIYRASDWTYVGKVTSVTNNTSLALTANAAVDMANERYYALKIDGDWSMLTNATTTKQGFLTATYADRQWYANIGSSFDKTYRTYFSDPDNFEAIDYAANDGDFLDVVSSTAIQTPLMGMMPAYNSLLLLKEKEAYGVFGSNPANFQLRKLSDDGTLSCMSVQAYQGGVLWAGRNGIQFYDGTTVQNLSAAKLGNFYTNSVRNFDPETHRMWSMLYRDHYLLFIESFASDFSTYRGDVVTTPTTVCIALNLLTRSFTTLSNVGITGSTRMSATSGQTSYFTINTSTTGYIVNADSLFTGSNADSLTCSGQTSGPDLYIQSRAYAMDDGTWRKVLREFTQFYRLRGGYLNVDFLPGLTNVGMTIGTLPATDLTWQQVGNAYTTWSSLDDTYTTWAALADDGAFEVERLRKDVRGPVFAYRIWRPSNQTIASATFGPINLRFKNMRAGRAR